MSSFCIIRSVIDVSGHCKRNYSAEVFLHTRRWGLVLGRQEGTQGDDTFSENPESQSLICGQAMLHNSMEPMTESLDCHVKGSPSCSLCSGSAAFFFMWTG